jgi:hypothetical protein
MTHLRPISPLRGTAATMLLQNAARLGHLYSVSRNLGLFLFADTIPMARNMLITEQGPDLF